LDALDPCKWIEIENTIFGKRLLRQCIKIQEKILVLDAGQGEAAQVKNEVTDVDSKNDRREEVNLTLII